MMAAITRVLRLIKQFCRENAFTRCNSVTVANDQLKNLVSTISAFNVGELGFNEGHISLDAPVTYFPIYEDSEVIASIFALRDGMSLPLHDHPDMYGFIRCVHGSLKISSYSKLQADSSVPSDYNDTSPGSAKFIKPTTIHVTLDSTKVIDTSEETVVLTPDRGNIHTITAVNGSAAFLDFLTPPYSTPKRPCHYYKLDSNILNCDSNFLLTEIGCPPTYWCTTALHHQLLGSVVFE